MAVCARPRLATKAVNDRGGEALRVERTSEIARLLTIGERPVVCLANRRCNGSAGFVGPRIGDVVQHHHGRHQQREWVGNPLSGDVGRRSMHRLENRIFVADVRAWNDAQAAEHKKIAAAIKKAGAVPGLQIAHAGDASLEARHIKLADKICNVRDLATAPPAKWSLERRIAYVDWAEKVVNGLRGSNDRLEQYFDEVSRMTRKHLKQE